MDLLVALLWLGLVVAVVVAAVKRDLGQEHDEPDRVCRGCRGECLGECEEEGCDE